MLLPENLVKKLREHLLKNIVKKLWEQLLTPYTEDTQDETHGI